MEANYIKHKRMSIKNKEIEKYRDLLIEIYKDDNQKKQDRINAAVKVNIINLIVAHYEDDYELTYDDLTWNEVGDPLLPDQFERLLKSIQKQLKR